MSKFKRRIFLPHKIAERERRLNCYSSKHNLLDIIFELGLVIKSNDDLKSCIRLNSHLMHLIGQFKLARVKSDA